jgi:hypothetical protein
LLGKTLCTLLEVKCPGGSEDTANIMPSLMLQTYSLTGVDARRSPPRSVPKLPLSGFLNFKIPGDVFPIKQIQNLPRV